MKYKQHSTCVFPPFSRSLSTPLFLLTIYPFTVEPFQLSLLAYIHKRVCERLSGAKRELIKESTINNQQQYTPTTYDPVDSSR
jgi:hypothetical protein